MAREKQRLTTDLEALLPGDSLKIGETTILIRPLGLLQLSLIIIKLKGFAKALVDDGVTFDNYNKPENLLKVAEVLLTQFPDILEEASNIHIDDLNELPIEIIISIICKVVDVNMKSKSTLEKNFKSLVEKFQTLENPNPENPKK